MNNHNNKLEIKKFDIDDMVENPTIVMVAKRGSGKSWIVKAIMNKLRSIPAWVVISPTDHVNPFFAEFVPECYIYNEFETEILKNILYRQEQLKELKTNLKEKAKKTGNKYKIPDTRIGLIMDDCLASASDWKKDVHLKEILQNGRHFDITFILTMQFPLGISPELRVNFDYVFLLSDDNIANLDKLHQHYAGIFPDRYSFKKTFFELTQDYSAMVLIKRDTGDKFEDKVQFYKAPDLRNVSFTVGHKQYCKYNEKNYEKNWRKKIGININDLRKK